MFKRVVAAAVVSALVVAGATGAGAAPRSAATMTVHLSPVGKSHVMATATITYSMMRHQTVVVLHAVHLTVGTHLAHFHIGHCGSNGMIKYPLTSLIGPGAASSTTVFPYKLKGTLYINIHGNGKNIGIVVACGNAM